MKHLPPLTFLRSFEATARLSSFTAAADELGLTQSAVSNHVRSLEDFIGRPLFVRLPRALALTELGAAYLPGVRQALQQIDTATEAILTQPRKREVVVSCPTSLATHWLAGAVRGFHAAHPDIQLTLHGTVWTDVEAHVADVSITVCHEDERPADATLLWADRLALICAPGFRVGGETLSDPAQLPEAELIRILGRLDYWDRMARHFGLPRLAVSGGLQTDVTALAVEWAAQGLGCAAVPRALIGSATDRGLVVEPFACDADCPWLYCVRFKDRQPAAPVRLFRDWLLAQAAGADR